MRALVVTPGISGTARVQDVPEPSVGAGEVLVETLGIGVCGTDLEIVAAQYGQAPPGEEYLVLGHESLGRVLEAPADCGLTSGDLVAAIVRRPDPVPCTSCAVGEWDMCRNGQYTERGIKGLHGYASERYAVAPEFAVKLDERLERVGVLLEPTTVVAKAWEHIERIGRRAHWEPASVAVTGAGPVGLLAALLGKQRDLDVHVLDVVGEGIKPDLVHALGATYHTKPISDIGLEPDIILECSGVPSVVIDVLSQSGHDGIVCLTGVSPTGRTVDIDAGALGRQIVLQNDAIFGSVNANRRHYEQAAQALADTDLEWLGRLITRTVPLDDFHQALERTGDDVKVVLDLKA